MLFSADLLKRTSIIGRLCRLTHFYRWMCCAYASFSYIKTGSDGRFSFVFLCSYVSVIMSFSELWNSKFIMNGLIVRAAGHHPNPSRAVFWCTSACTSSSCSLPSKVLPFSLEGVDRTRPIQLLSGYVQ